MKKEEQIDKWRKINDDDDGMRENNAKEGKKS